VENASDQQSLIKSLAVENMSAQKRRRIGASAPITELFQVKLDCSWTKHQDPTSGKCYYYDTETGTSSWFEPPEYTSAEAARLRAEDKAAREAMKREEEQKRAAAKAAAGKAGASVKAKASERKPANAIELSLNFGKRVDRTRMAKAGEPSPPPPPPAKAKAEAPPPVPQEAPPVAEAVPAAEASSSEEDAPAAVITSVPPAAAGQPAAASAAAELGSTSSPATSSTAQAFDGGNSVSPSGNWIVSTDPNSGCLYYYNKVTMVSSWERPPDLAVDLSKPPPPPATKAPPAARSDAMEHKKDAAPGEWEEVAPEESQFHREDDEVPDIHVPGASTEDRDSDEEPPPDQLAETKLKLMGKRGEWAPEDLELRQKEVFVKKSSVLADEDSPAAAKAAAFPMSRVKKSAGIRKRPRDDDD